MPNTTKAAMMLALVVASGCGQSRHPVVDVSAKVYLDDKPYGPGTLSLSPRNQPEKPKKGEIPVPNATGEVSQDGTATFSSYTGTKGIVPGTYQVFLAPDPMAIGQAPTVKPATITVEKGIGSLEIKLQSVKGAKPGMIPPTDSVGGASTELTIQTPR